MLVLVSLFAFGKAAVATHIVGGEIYYELVSATRSEYKITLRVFVDCENGSSAAIAQDKEAIIGVFDAGTRAYQTKYVVTRIGPNRINKVNYSCVKPPTGVCVDEYVYQTTRVINPGTNGKILAFQRCCRNNSINNIVSPQSTGATFWVKIPPSTVPNNSAKFKSLPPNYVCVNAPLTFDHSATDADGDSLVYSMSRPFQGASSNAPRPDPPASPNYASIVWKNGYSTFNQVDGSPLLTINSQTGEMTVTPTKIGQFVIGVVVKEYRKGVLVGETYRDYQMNVIKCEFDVLADFTTEGATASADAYVFECADTVYFVDRSQKAITYEWDFGDPTTTDDTSSQPNPWWVYPGNGDYRVTLKVKNEVCEDEYKFTIRIRSTQTFTLGPDRLFCRDFQVLLDTKTPDATSVDWSNGMEGQRIFVKDTGVYIATVSYDRCVYSDTMRIDKYPVTFEIPPDTLICDEVDVELDAGIPNHYYQWSTSPADTLQKVRVFAPGNYIVSVSNEYCTEHDTIRVWQASTPKVDDAFYCNAFIHHVDGGSFEEGEYLWSNGSTDKLTTYNTPGTHWLRLTQRHCVHTDSFKIENSVVQLDLGVDQHFCDEVDTQLDAGAQASYVWNTDQSIRKIQINLPGRYWVDVVNEFGCEASDTVEFTLSSSPPLEMGYDTTICLRSVIEIGPASQPDIVKYQWNTGESSRKIETEFENNYILTITDTKGCTTTDSLYVTVDPTALPNVIYIPNAFTPNGDNLNEFFPYSETILQPGYFIVIYNRWGQKVFDSRESTQQNWDGVYQGKTAYNETFFYYAEYFGCDGLKRSIKGTVNPLY